MEKQVRKVLRMTVLILYLFKLRSIKTIICTLCLVEKPIESFYKNNKTSSGCSNQCKECVKKRAKLREEKLRQDPEWVEKEKIRGREKYKRLGYAEKQKEWDKDKPWKNTFVYKNLNRNLKLSKTETAHHWCYNDDKLKDVFVLSRKFHKYLHKFLVLSIDDRLFKTKDGILLDTKEKHSDFINKIKEEYDNRIS